MKKNNLKIGLIFLLIIGFTTNIAAQKNGGHKKTTKIDGTKLQVVYTDIIVNATPNKVWETIATNYTHIGDINSTINESYSLNKNLETTGKGSVRHCSLNAFGKDMEVSEKIIEYTDTNSKREFTYEAYDFVNFPMKKMFVTWGIKLNDQKQTVLYGINKYRMKMGMMSGMMRGKIKGGITENLIAFANNAETGKKNVDLKSLQTQFKDRSTKNFVTYNSLKTITKKNQNSQKPVFAHFKKGKLIEVAFMSIKKGKEKQLKQDYFAKVMPIAMEYGLRPIMTISVTDSHSKDINPQMIGFYEWPSRAKRESFDKDPRFLKIKGIRTDALSFLKVAYYEVQKDTKVNLNQKSYYELYAMTMDKQNGHLMKEYFGKVGPVVTKDYRVDFALSMTSVNMNNEYHFISQSFGIAIWRSVKENKDFFSSKLYNEVKHLKDKAIKRLDVWHGFPILQ